MRFADLHARLAEDSLSIKPKDIKTLRAILSLLSRKSSSRKIKALTTALEKELWTLQNKGLNLKNIHVR